MCVAACNFYSDNARWATCTLDGDILIADEEASAVYDTAIYLAGIYHIIEWIRATMLLTVIVVGTNLMWVWYGTIFNALFGVGVFIYLHTAYAGEKGQACKEA